MNKNGTSAVLSSLLAFFYFGIILYVLFAIVNIAETKNAVAAIIFESFGFISLVCFIIGGFLTKTVKTGYFVPLVMVTIIYNLILDALVIAGAANISSPFFILANLVLLFIYGIVSVPMYLMGKR